MKSKKAVKIVDLKDVEIRLLKKIDSFPDVVAKAYENLAPNLIANYCFELSKLFNEFYLFKNSNKLGSTGKFNVSTQLHQLAFKYKNKSNLNSFTGNDIINIYSK